MSESIIMMSNASHDAQIAADHTKEAVETAKHKAEQTLEEARHSASELAEKAGHKASEVAHEAAHSAKELLHKAQDKISEEKKEGGLLDRLKDKAETVLHKDLNGDGKIG